MLNPWPSLKKFDIMLFECPLPWGEFLEEKAESLRLGREDMRGLVPACLGAAPNLCSFRFCPGDILPSGFLHHFVQKCPLVEVLVIDGLNILRRDTLKELNALKLKELRLRGVSNHMHVNNYNGIGEGLRGQNELRVLDVRGQSLRGALFDFPFPLELLKAVSRECPNISEIYIDVARQHLPPQSVISSFDFSFGNEVIKFTVHDDKDLQDFLECVYDSDDDSDDDFSDDSDDDLY